MAMSRARHSIRVAAPLDGTAAAVTAGVGQAVGTGAPLASVIPDGHPLRAELYLGSEAIGLLRTGQRVSLRYDAFPYQRYGLYGGSVVEVGRAPSMGSGAGEGRRGLYRVVVAPDRATVRVEGAETVLQAGMDVRADVEVERRTLLRWLLSPLESLRSSAGLVAGARV